MDEKTKIFNLSEQITTNAHILLAVKDEKIKQRAKNILELAQELNRTLIIDPTINFEFQDNKTYNITQFPKK